MFKLFWETLEAGQEIFAYVVNLAKYGDYYWVFAHATPSFGPESSCLLGFAGFTNFPLQRVRNPAQLCHEPVDDIT